MTNGTCLSTFSFVCACAVGSGVHRGGVGERVERAAEVGLQWASHSPQQKRQHQRRVSCTIHFALWTPKTRHILLSFNQNPATFAPSLSCKTWENRAAVAAVLVPHHTLKLPCCVFMPCVLKRRRRSTIKTKVTFSLWWICQWNSLFPLGLLLF